jgi:hypothetical protein
MTNVQTHGARLDEALDRLERYAPEFGGFLSNHGPMGIEALAQLGREDAVPGWLRWYEPRLEERWSPHERVTGTNWQQALGDRSRYANWVAFFEGEMSEGPWQQVVGEWSSRLAPGLSGSATHGVIRSGHAVRAIARQETPQRRRELANGLAYWAAGFRRLPEAASEHAFSPAEAVELLPKLPAEQQARPGWDRRVAALPEFAATINLVSLGEQPEQEISLLTQTFAEVYLANAALPGRVIIPIHAVTSATAVRHLLPFVDDNTAARLVRYVWQAGAAITTAFAADRRPVEVDAHGDWQDLIDMAVSGLDEHAIKFTEACYAEFALTGAPIFYAAAADAVARLTKQGGPLP